MMIRSLLAAWLLAEAIVYALFFTFFSVAAGFLIGISSIAAGVITLRFGGRQFVRNAILHFSSPAALTKWRSAPLGLLGAVLLLVPGFISDALGLLFVILGVVALWRRPSPGARTRDVELSSDEWTRLPDEPPK